MIKLRGWALPLVLVLLFVSGCASAPTAWEQKFFDIETNTLPRVVVVTNVVPSAVTNTVVVMQTNRVTESEVRIVPVTNETVVVTFRTNEVVATNWVQAYTFTPNTNATALVGTASRAAGLLGPWGDLVGVVLGGLIGAYGMVRSTRASKTAGVLAQVIETGRQVLQSTPQGQALDEQWKVWMVQHQAEEGVIEDVVRLLANVVDEPSAKQSAQELVEMLNAKG